MVSHSSVCFKAIVFVATSIRVLVLLCCPTFVLFVQFHSHWQLSLGMLSLQSSHLTHAWSSTILCAMSHHASFFLLDHVWNSVPSRNACCVCGMNHLEWGRGYFREGTLFTDIEGMRQCNWRWKSKNNKWNAESQCHFDITEYEMWVRNNIWMTKEGIMLKSHGVV